VNILNYPEATIRNMEINAGAGNAVHIENSAGFVGDSTVSLIDNMIRGDNGAAVDIVQNGETSSLLDVAMSGNTVRGSRSALDATTGGDGGELVLDVSDNIFSATFPGSVIGFEVSIQGDTVDRPWQLTNLSSEVDLTELRLDLEPTGLSGWIWLTGPRRPVGPTMARC